MFAAASAVVVASRLALLAEFQRRATDRERTIAVQERATAFRTATAFHASWRPSRFRSERGSGAGDSPRFGGCLSSTDHRGRRRAASCVECVERARSSHSGQGVHSAAGFSGDGRLIVTAGGDDSARIWDAASGRELLRIQHGSSLDTAWFSPNGTYVVTVGDDGRSRVWRTDSGARVSETGPAARGAFNKDESRFVTSGEEDAALWDTRTWQKIRTMKDGTTVSSFSEDGRVLLTVDSEAAVLSDQLTGRTRARLNGEFTNAALTPGAEVVALTGEGAAKIWHIETKKVVTLPGTCDEIAISSDGRVVATAHEDEEDGIVRLWDAQPARGSLRCAGGSAAPRAGPSAGTAICWSLPTKTARLSSGIRGRVSQWRSSGVTGRM